MNGILHLLIGSLGVAFSLLILRADPHKWDNRAFARLAGASLHRCGRLRMNRSRSCAIDGWTTSSANTWAHSWRSTDVTRARSPRQRGPIAATYTGCSGSTICNED